MKQIPLTQGLVALVDEADYEDIARFSWCAQRGGHTFYACRREHGQSKLILMHRQLLQVLDGPRVDHRNGNGLDNQRTNLRCATNAQNQANRMRLVTNTSGRRGVSWNRQMRRWHAYIGNDGRNIHLGYFTDLDDAARAYDVAARSLFGEFARPNFSEVAS